MAAAYTPGPWVLERHVGGQFFGNIVSYGLGQDEYGTQMIRTIDCLRRGASEEEMEATGKLIAAAPEMLVALKLIDQGARNDEDRGDDLLWTTEWQHAVETVRGAILKAEG